MEKAMIWGAGRLFEMYHNDLSAMFEIVGIVDNDSSKEGHIIKGTKVYMPNSLVNLTFDKLLLITGTGKREQFLQAVQKLGILPKNIELIYFSNLNLLNGRVQHLRIPLELSEQGEMIVCREGVRILIRMDSDNWHFEEILLRDAYAFEIDNKETVCIDIGMNTGIASLYFANLPYVSKVYSYELFPQSFGVAERNFSLNGDLNSKITPHNFGLLDRDMNFQATFIGNHPGGSSAVFENHNLWGGGVQTSVTVKNAAYALKHIYDEHYGKRKILLKIDCEGAEYKILKAMESVGMLEKTDIIVGEWHVCDRLGDAGGSWDDFTEMRTRLVDSGFVCRYDRFVCKSSDSSDHATLYIGAFFAFKTR